MRGLVTSLFTHVITEYIFYWIRHRSLNEHMSNVLPKRLKPKRGLTYFFAVIGGKIVVKTQYYVEFMFHEVLTVVWLEINDGVGIIVFM